MSEQFRRQHVGENFHDEGLQTLITQDAKEAAKAAHRFTLPSTTTRRLLRTTPYRVSFAEDCDYLVHYCLRAYQYVQSLLELEFYAPELCIILTIRLKTTASWILLTAWRDMKAGVQPITKEVESQKKLL
ncbi:unnamed protein product [Leptosia nina]|uniref:Uncharacterized protein n=1 Tax=Leptosia nina TaxID=320188 RepID=A0AAV1IVC6_9NEOP